MAAPLPDRVPQGVLGEVLHLGQPELLALVHVGAAGQAEQQQDRGARPAGPEVQVGGPRRRVVRPPSSIDGARAAVARHVAGLVVVGQDPGRGRPDGAECRERAVDDRPQPPRVPAGPQEREVERAVQLVGAHVARESLDGRRVDLAQQDPRRVLRRRRSPATTR